MVEYLPLAPGMRDAISRETPVAELRRLALGGGLITMRDSALTHVTDGTIAFEELLRLLPAERMAPEIPMG